MSNTGEQEASSCFFAWARSLHTPSWSPAWTFYLEEPRSKDITFDISWRDLERNCKDGESTGVSRKSSIGKREASNNVEQAWNGGWCTENDARSGKNKVWSKTGKSAKVLKFSSIAQKWLSLEKDCEKCKGAKIQRPYIFGDFSLWCRGAKKWRSYISQS